MSFHVIKHKGTEYVGPSDYEREDQEAALALFIDMSAATAAYPNNPQGVVDHMLRKMPKPTHENPAYARNEQARHWAASYRAFKAAYSAHAKHQRGPKLPPHHVNAPTPLPEKLIPGQRVEMVDPDTGELRTVIVPPEAPGTDQAPPVDHVAVQLNAALSHCFETMNRNARQAEVLKEAADDEVLAEAARNAKEAREKAKGIDRQNIQLRNYYDVLNLVAAARPRYLDGKSGVEEIVRAEKISLLDHGLNYKKLREFIAAFDPRVAA